MIIIHTALLALLACYPTNPDEITLSYSQPEKPGLIRVDLILGKIKVVGGDQQQIRIESKSLSAGFRDFAKGLPRVGGPASGLRVSEADNRVVVEAPNAFLGLDLTLWVPRQTSLQLNLGKGSGIEVVDVTGDLELSAEKGPIVLTNVAGSVVAHALSDSIQATLRAVAPGKAMSFTSLQGDIDVSLPAGLNADLRLVTYRGEIFSDLKADFSPRGTITTEDERAGGGNYQMDYEQALHGKLGKGGPEYLFKSYRGNLFLRRTK